MNENILLEKIDDNKNNPFWYFNETIAEISNKKRKIIISSAGEIRVKFLKISDNSVDNEIFYENEQAISLAIENNFTDENLTEQEFDESNWFDFFYIDESCNKEFDILGDECFSYDEAIEYAKKTIIDDEWWKNC